MSGRPGLVVLVVGTATEVGKTWTTAALVRGLCAEGRRVAAAKPVQSYEPGGEPTDAEVLAAATGQSPEEVCRSARCYEVAMAPPMAADALDRPPILLADLVDELSWSADVEVAFVETVGGVRSPMAHDGDAVALAEALDPDLVVLVADAGLGTINAVRLSLAPLPRWPALVCLNRFDPGDELHRRNLEWLRARDGLDVAVEVDAAVASVLAALDGSLDR